MSEETPFVVESYLKNVSGDLCVFYSISDKKMVYEHEWCSTWYAGEIGIKLSDATKEKLEEIKERLISAYGLAVKSFYEEKAKNHLEKNIKEIKDFFTGRLGSGANNEKN